jgi:hypothetical protein
LREVTNSTPGSVREEMGWTFRLTFLAGKYMRLKFLCPAVLECVGVRRAGWAEVEEEKRISTALLT